MRRWVVTNMALVVSALVLLAGSIVTFNFGLEEVFSTSHRISNGYFCGFDDSCYPLSSTVIARPLVSGDWLVLLIFVVGAFILGRAIMGRNSGGRMEKGRKGYRVNSWGIVEPRWMTPVYLMQATTEGIRRRPFKSIRA